jgi:hypothetical protein
MAEITDKIILGLDFLEANKAIVDHGQYSIHINGEMIQETFALNEQEEHLQIYRAKIENTTVIPPFCMKFVETKLNLKPKGDIVIQPSSPNALCSNEDTTFLMVRNHTNKNVTLKKKQIFGQGAEVQNIIGNEQIDSCLVRHNSLEKNLNPNIPDLKSKLPEYLKDLNERSIEKLNQSEARRVAQLLIEYQDVLSKGDLDIGLFNRNIKHRIDTGDAKPTKQRLRRTPLQFEKVEENHLKQIVEKVLSKNLLQNGLLPLFY